MQPITIEQLDAIRAAGEQKMEDDHVDQLNSSQDFIYFVSQGEALDRLFDAGVTPPQTREARAALAEELELINGYEGFANEDDLTLAELIENSRRHQPSRVLSHEEVWARLSWWAPQLPALDVAGAGMRAMLSYDGKSVVFKPAPGGHSNESVARKLGLLGENESVEKIKKVKAAK